jgi:hypothetical protein
MGYGYHELQNSESGLVTEVPLKVYSQARCDLGYVGMLEILYKYGGGMSTTYLIYSEDIWERRRSYRAHDHIYSPFPSMKISY